MAVTNEDLQIVALQLGNLQMQVTVLEREKRELTAELKATKERLELVGNPDGLVVEKATQMRSDG